jgi:hypothetical protein
MKTCTFDGCDRPHAARGWCGPHYQQKRRGAELHPVTIQTPKPASCTYPDCKKPYSGRGLCEGHLEQGRRGKPLTPLQHRQAQIGPCSECGDRPSRTKGLCRPCYERSHKALGRRLIGQTATIKAAPRVTSDKPKRNLKSDPPRNKNLPRGWDAVKAKTPPVRKQTSSNGDMSGDFGPVKPIDGKLAAAMRDRLAVSAALDLAEMLGVAS